jgi:hypothetical protein
MFYMILHVCILFLKIPLTTTTIHTNKTIDDNLDSKLLDINDQIEENAIDITNV